MRILVEVPQGKDELVLSLMEELGYPAHIYEGESDTAEWQKEDVRATIADTKPEDYISLDDFLKEWEKK